MQYDDGIYKFYKIQNTADKGDKPKPKLKYETESYVNQKTVGINRFYTAMANKQSIDNVITIYDDDESRNIRVNDVAIDEFSNQFLIRMIQLSEDENGIKILVISLERLEKTYEIISKC